jgi:uncharacterized protein (TIGR02117 family)
MKNVIKFFLRFLVGLILFVGTYLLLAYLLPKITFDKDSETKEEVTIFVITNGVHTDIVVPARSEEYDWTKEIKYTDAIKVDSTYSYLGMGWGDKGFYLETPTWAELKFSVAFKAATGINTTAIHATYFKPENLIESDTCIRIGISKVQFSHLTKYIKNSFKTDPDGHFINIKTDANYGNTDAFYEAKGRYNIMHTCNEWTNYGLKSAGQKYCLWTPFDTGIFNLYKKN